MTAEPDAARSGAAAPLAGVTVADFTQNVAGPFAAMILADMGADVIKVEKPGQGDATRDWGPPFPFGQGAAFLALNRNKRSLELDLSQPEGRGAAERLIQRAHVVIESARPGAMDRLGLGPGRALELSPHLVYCSISAFGTLPSMATERGYDPLVQALTGLMQATGVEGGDPARVGTSIVDMGTGLWAAIGILAALRAADSGRGGTWLQASLFETGMAWMGYQAIEYWATGNSPRRWGTGLSSIVPYQAFPAADAPVMIAAGNDGLFGRLVRALGADSLADDPRFRRNSDRVQHREALIAILSDRTAAVASADLVDRLRVAGVPCAKIRTLGEALSDDDVLASGLLQSTEQDGGTLRLIGTPLLFAGQRCSLRLPPPQLGEHTADVLTEMDWRTASSAGAHPGTAARRTDNPREGLR
jgi:crotonobetainyl-CoA:carnitine CoA-transferase CaiB-like acyl-CoA transferase